MQAALKELNRSCLWHFTDKKNFESITEYGLLSWKELRNRGLVPVAPGGNDWSHEADQRFGVDGYVHLSFSKQHPMLYVAKKDGRITDPIWLKIDLSVLNDNGVRFTSDVANKAGIGLLENNAAKESIDLVALFNYLDFGVEGNRERKQAAEKSEILIPILITPNKILGFENG